MISAFVIGMLRLYQTAVSPIFPFRCRFLPTCSQYMIDAVESKGALAGIFLGIVRLLKCNPLFPWGYDPAPEK